MNIQPGNSSGQQKKKNRNDMQGGGWNEVCRLIARVLNIAVFLAVYGALLHTYIKFDQQINAASVEINRINEEISQIAREVDSLNNEYAYCSSRAFIDKQIAKFNLPLQELRQSQQKRIHLYSNAQLAKIFRRGYLADRRVAVDNRLFDNPRRKYRQ